MPKVNNRIFYACQGVAICAQGADPGAGEMVHGVQSVGITSNFNLEQAFELGQIEIYENIEGTPDVEVTLEKVLDGYPLMYLMASTGVTGSSASGLVARSKEQCDLRLGIFGEEFNNLSSAGDAQVEVYCSGMFVSSVGYTLPVDGSATESLTLVGNNKKWLRDSATTIKSADVVDFDGLDEPLAFGVESSPSGGIQRREDVLLQHCILPRSIYGVNGSGVGNAYIPVSAGQDPTASGLSVHVQNVSINTDFSREDILELGRKTPFYRPAGFPIEVSCEIEVISTSGDFVFAIEDGDPALFESKSSGNNTSEENIYFLLRGGMTFDLGSKNRLSSVSYGGGDATGGNVSNTYSYTNFNDLDVKQVGHNATGVMGFNGAPTSAFA